MSDPDDRMAAVTSAISRLISAHIALSKGASIGGVKDAELSLTKALNRHVARLQ